MTNIQKAKKLRLKTVAHCSLHYERSTIKDSLTHLNKSSLHSFYFAYLSQGQQSKQKSPNVPLTSQSREHRDVPRPARIYKLILQRVLGIFLVGHAQTVNSPLYYSSPSQTCRHSFILENYSRYCRILKTETNKCLAKIRQRRYLWSCSKIWQ